ncbi:hypothetical protein FACS189493_3640 [Spirochaetia bacterium]|nr:hypothetical protein FACS189493_3640 [Spirochaetia bacterium]
MHRKVGPALALAAAVVLMACEWAIPETASVKASPEFVLPLGIKLNISEYLDMEEILGTLSGSVDGLKIYKYTNTSIDLDGTTVNGDTDVQTYLMRYPIANMPLDLTEYMEDPDNISLPPITVPLIPDGVISILGGIPIYVASGGLYLTDTDLTGLLPYTITPVPLVQLTDLAELKSLLNNAGGVFSYVVDEDAVPPLASVDLADTELGKWMKNIQMNAGSGIKITGQGDALDTTIAMKIPALGITAYQTDSTTNGTFEILATSAPAAKLLAETPSGSGIVDPNTTKIEVFVKLTAIPSGELPISLVFDWNNADVSPGSAGDQTGSFPMPDLGGLTEMLGGLKFASIPAYMYVNGLPGSSHTMELKVGANPPLVSGSVSLEQALGDIDAAASGSGAIKTYAGAIPASSTGLIQFAPLLNGEQTGDLDFAIHVGTVNVAKGSLDAAKTISADILLVLPVLFEVTAGAAGTPDEAISIGGADYIKVNLEMLNNISTDGDLLKSIRPTLKDFGDITKLSLGINVTRNDIFDGLYLGIKSGNDWTALDLSSAGPNDPLTFDNDEINGDDGLVLSIAVLMRDTSGSGTGTLNLKPFPAEAGLDIKITAGVKADIDAQIF